MKTQSVLGIVLMIGGGVLVAALIGKTASNENALPQFSDKSVTVPVTPKETMDNQSVSEQEKLAQQEQMDKDQQLADEAIKAKNLADQQALLKAKEESEAYTKPLTVQSRPVAPQPAPKQPTAKEKEELARKAAAEKIAKEKADKEKADKERLAAEKIAQEKQAQLAKQEAQKPAPTTGGNGTYTVMTGDTLGAIAKQYGVSIDTLAKANGMGRDDALFAGATLKLPAGAKRGEAVKEVAKKAEQSTTFALKPAEVKTEKPAPKPEPKPAESKSVSNNGTHTIKVGDTLGHLAKQYGVSVDDIANANGMGRDDMLAEGRVIRVPTGKRTEVKATQPAQKTEVRNEPKPTPKPATPKTEPKPAVVNNGTHTMKAGDTLGHLAKQYGVSVDDIANANGMGRDDMIPEGRVLKIPTKKSQ